VTKPASSFRSLFFPQQDDAPQHDQSRTQPRSSHRGGAVRNLADRQARGSYGLDHPVWSGAHAHRAVTPESLRSYGSL